MPRLQRSCRRGGVAHLLGGHCPSFIAPTDSCANPIPLFSPSVVPRLRSLRRLCPAPAASGIFPTLFLRILPRMLGPYPGGTAWCTYLFLPLRHRPSPRVEWVGFPRCPAKRFPSGREFRGCRHFVMFRPPSLLAPQIVPTAARIATGQPGLLRPSRTCFVTSACIGYASRPNSGN